MTDHRASSPGEALLDEGGVAATVGVSVATVRRWRQQRTGPPFVRVGACVRYRPADLAAWIDTLPRGGSARSEEVAHASA